MTLLEEYEKQNLWRDWERYLSRLPLTHEQTVYDLGCAAGTVTKLLAKRVRSAIGFDNDKTLLNEAHKSKPENCRFIFENVFNAIIRRRGDMRSESEMIHLIISTAKEDERIRAVCLCGSRVNPNAPKDIFRDYDIAYVVAETGTFRSDRHWIDRFGNRLYMQYPEDSAYYPSNIENCYGWLMQFDDGNRLDLHVYTLQYALRALEEDPLYKILLDKDGCLPDPLANSDSHYWVKKPTEKEFQCTCNEYWWCLNNVAKGLWREEIPYAMDMLNASVRPMLVRLLSWKIGIDHDFSVSIGKSGKYLRRFLTPQTWERFLKTYPDADIANIWNATIEMCSLVDETATEIGNEFGFIYNGDEAKGSRAYLEHIRRLPKNAAGVF